MDLLGTPIHDKNNPRQQLEIPIEIPVEISTEIKSPTIEQDNTVWFEKYRPVTALHKKPRIFVQIGVLHKNYFSGGGMIE